jgi:hypothetical protein
VQSAPEHRTATYREYYTRCCINRLTPNDPYMVRTAPLTSKRCILYIYSTNTGTEYFKHALFSPFFSLQNAVCFIMLTCLVHILFTFYIQGVLKLKKKIPAPKGQTRSNFPILTYENMRLLKIHQCHRYICNRFFEFTTCMSWRCTSSVSMSVVRKETAIRRPITRIS